MELTNNQGTIPIRFGLIFGPLRKANLDAFKYFVLQLNLLQSHYEYEILENKPDDKFIEYLSKSAGNSFPRFFNKRKREEVKEKASTYFEDLKSSFEELTQDFKCSEKQFPDKIILITTAKLVDNFYTARGQNISALCLGNWKKHMSPPSIAEFIFNLIIRESYGLCYNDLSSSMHLGTKGCLFDFTESLSEAKFKVLNSFICNHCKTVFRKNNIDSLCDDLSRILKKDWLGDYTNPKSPVSIMKKLGFDLFVVKGFQKNRFYLAISWLWKNILKQIIIIGGSLILAYLLIYFGLNSKNTNAIYNIW